MVINIQLFELGNLLHHIYSKKTIKFLDIPMSSDKNIEADNDLLTLNNFLVKHLPSKVTINGKTTAVKTDDDGIAKIEITEDSGTYVMTTSLPVSDNEVNNTVIVKEVPAPSPDDKPTPRPVPYVRQTYSAKSTYSPQHVYTVYRAYDMKMICQANAVNLKALMDLFNQTFTNGHLKVYNDGTLVFDGDVDDDLSRVIFEIIEKFLGKHEVNAEFTDSSGKTQTFNETMIIE